MQEALRNTADEHAALSTKVSWLRWSSRLISRLTGSCACLQLRQTQLQLTLARAQATSASPELPNDVLLGDVTAMYKEQYEVLRQTMEERTREIDAVMLDKDSLQQQL